MSLLSNVDIDALLQSSLSSAIDSYTRTIKESESDIKQLSTWIIEAISQGKKIFFFGNGGSAADSQHLAAEFINRFRLDRHPLPAIALTTDSSIITSISNDYGYEYIFSKQLEALCTQGDIAIGISTSGSSQNVILGLKVASKKGAKSVALTGNQGLSEGNIVDMVIKAASSDTPRIQETHIFIGHLICDIVEKGLFNK